MTAKKAPHFADTPDPWRQFGGYASSREAPDTHAYWGNGPGSYPSTWFTWYTPPHRLALTPEECDHVIACTERAPEVPQASPQLRAWTLNASVLGDFAERVIAPAATANGLWWRYDLAGWSVHVRHYRGGFEKQNAHMDYKPNSQGEKLTMLAQLSHGDDYQGGRLDLWNGNRHDADNPDGFIEAPAERGSVIVLPGWLPHRVSAVDSGERWLLIIHGEGPPFR